MFIRYNTFLIFLLLIGVSYASTLTSCDVKTSCTGGETAVFSMSNTTNAHGAVDPAHYSYKVCCAGTGISNSYVGGDRTAVVVRLNKSTNAHGERPDYTNYNFPVYLSATDLSYNMSCEYTTSCSPDYVAVMSLEQDTNSHIGNKTAYSNLVCCKTEFYGADTDSDGINDVFDNLWFNESNVTTTGITSLEITLDGDTSIDGNIANSSQLLQFYDTSEFFNMTYPFDQKTFDLRNLSIYDSGSYIGLDAYGMISGTNTTLIFDGIVDVTYLCVKTADNDHPSEISGSCTGPDEHDFQLCIGGSYSADGINCIYTGGKFYIDGIDVLGAEQFNSLGPGGPEIPEFTVTGILAAVVVVLAASLIIVKKH